MTEDILAYLAEKGHHPKRERGGEYIYLCFFCEKPDRSGHLYINRAKGVYTCHRCGEAGNLTTLRRHFGDSDPPSHESIDAAHSRESEILRAAADYYHAALTPDHRKYLNARGITDEVIDRFRIGSARGGLRAHLESFGYSRDEMIASGLVKDDGLDFFFRNITFPNFSRGGVIDIRARTDPSVPDKHYLNRPEHPVQLFNPDASSAKQPILCEGEPDTLTLLQHGLAACGVPGVGCFKPEWLPLFARAERIAIAFDGDTAGKRGALRTAAIIGPRARIVRLPDGQDVNDFFLAGGTKERFEELITTAKTELEARIDAVQSLPPADRPDAIHFLLPRIAASDPLTREHYRTYIHTTLDIRAGVVDEAIEKVRQSLKDPPPEASQPTAVADEEAAVELLTDPQILDRMLDILDRMGCIGEEVNKIVLFLAMTSRKLHDPISLSVKGESSAGKSFLVEKVRQLFPPEDQKVMTAMSRRALFHEQTSLAHKILIIYEHEGADDADYSIRSLLSERQVVFSIVVKNPDTGEFQTVEHRVEGPVTYIETTTRPHLHPENETRSFDLFVDESEAQTERIFDAQNRDHLADSSGLAEEIELWRDAQRLLEPLSVRIPFIRHMKFPTKPLRVRRDRPRFLELVKASAFLHQKRRTRITVGDRECIAAEIFDYGIAYRVALEILGHTVRSTSPKVTELLACVRDLTNAGTDATLRALEAALGWSSNTVRRYVQEAEKQGFVDRDTSQRAHRFTLARSPEEIEIPLLSPEELQERIDAASPQLTTT